MDGRLSVTCGAGGEGSSKGALPTSLFAQGQLCPYTEVKFNLKTRILDLKQSLQKVNICYFWVVWTQVFVMMFSTFLSFQNI